MLRGAPALLTSLITSCLIMLAPLREAGAIAQSEDDALRDALGREEVIVSGSMSRADASIKQRGPVASLQIPLPDTLSAEGLLSQYTLPPPNESTCARQFCLLAETIEAHLLAQPEVHYLLGLRFDGLLASAPAQRAPVNLVALVDRSESMRGAALDLTKASLVELVRHLTPQDQLSIVLYGSSVRTHIGPTPVTAKGRKRLLAAIDRLRRGEGPSRVTEALELGFRLAHAAGNDFEGADRVMLFTDQPPGELDVAETLAAAERGAQLGIGLTTVGMGLAFDPDLAASLGSVRGGNQVFIRNHAQLAEAFGAELHTLLSELAYDVRMRITPAPGYRIAGVYGIPGAQVHFAGEQGIDIAVPTAFLGLRAGQLLVSLAQREDGAVSSPDAPLAQVVASHIPARGPTEPEVESLWVTPSREPSAALQLGRLLIDEFTSLRQASIAYHMEGNQRAAFEHVHALAPRLRNSAFAGLERDRRWVNLLEEQLAFLSGHGDDDQLVRSRISRLWGVWRVRSIQGHSDFRANERIEFTPDSKFRCFEKESGRHVATSVANISANREQIVMDYSGVVYNYEVRGSELVLEERPGTLVFLQRSRLD